MGRDFRELIQDILEKMYAIENIVRNKTEKDFEEDDILRDAILYKLIVIGEASNHISDEIYNKYPGISWHNMRGLRNILTHEYFRTDNKIIWEIITEDLPETRKKIEKIK
jgi:uncharacterized protein with HEPN domain